MAQGLDGLRSRRTRLWVAAWDRLLCVVRKGQFGASASPRVDGSDGHSDRCQIAQSS